MSNQFLNSESIFEVIGNYPVVDQFDVLYTNLQSGSYVDRYITGSMFVATRGTPTNRGGFTYSPPSPPRQRVFSKLGVDATKLPDQQNIRSYNLQPWRERAGTVKNLKIFSNSERFYDSLLPDITKLIKTLGGSIGLFSGYGILSMGSPEAGAATPGHTYGFIESFPFEPKFSKIGRVKRFSANLVATIEYGVGTSIESTIVSKLVIQIIDGTSPIAMNYWYDTTTGNPTLEGDSIKILFGFGDKSTKGVYTGDDLDAVSGSLGLPVGRYSSGTARIGPIIRGWKYGIQDGNPHYTSCVFRRDRFGQHRDMLEQRLYPVSYLDYENAPTRFFGDVETSATPNPSPGKIKNVTIEYPLTVTFVKQQVVTLGTSDSPIEFLVSVENKFRNETWSSNLSSYATSSLPYFDLENSSLGRNRDEIPNLVINPEAVYTKV